MRSQSLFGSRVRAAALETLASTSKPLTAYRVAKVIGAQPIQVLTNLRSLEPELVRHTHEGWIMTSDLLRQFLRERLEREEGERRTEKDEILVRLKMSPRKGHGRH
jgi:hypothetical protein